MKHTFTILSALLLVPLAVVRAADAPDWKSQGMIQDAPLGFGKMQRSSETPRQGERWELTFALAASFRNPFDPDEVQVDLGLTSPSGKKLIVPAFYYFPCALSPDGTVRPAGTPAWKVRFTPLESGVYRYLLRARDHTGTIKSAPGEFTCHEAKARGMLRVARQVTGAFEFADGTPYHPLGWNLHPWTPPDREAAGRLPAMLSNLDRLAASGGNFIRLRADSFYVPIEAAANARSGFLGLGFYHPGAAWEIDQVYAKAERQGIMLMHCFLEGNSYAHKLANPELRNRYNAMLAANGGPCAEPFDFWSNTDAANLMKKHLRYAIARWGYSPNLMAWELCNEVEDRDGEGRDLTAVVRWHQEQARFIKSTDPAGHLVSTSSNLKKGQAVEGQALWRLAEMDFCQTHLYGNLGFPDSAVDFPRVSREFHAAYAKPVVFGEYGIGLVESKSQPDPLGIYVHNGLFAAALDGGGAGAANWFVDELLKQGHERHLATFAQFTAEVPWNDPRLKSLRFGSVKSVSAGETGYHDVAITPRSRDPMNKSEHEHFTVDPATREVSGTEFLQPYLHAMKKRKSCPTFLLDCAVPAEFVVTVARSMGDERNALVITLDGVPALTHPFPAGEEHGTNHVFAAAYNNWTCDYHVDVKLPVPQGRHEVRVEAVGKDRLEVGYRVLHYSPAGDPVAMVGRGTKDRAWLWIRNQLSTDENDRLGLKLNPIERASATIEGLSDGRYKFQFLDPWSDRTFPAGESSCSNGRLKLSTPSFTRSLLCTVRKMP